MINIKYNTYEVRQTKKARGRSDVGLRLALYERDMLFETFCISMNIDAFFFLNNTNFKPVFITNTIYSQCVLSNIKVGT